MTAHSSSSSGPGLFTISAGIRIFPYVVQEGRELRVPTFAASSPMRFAAWQVDEVFVDPFRSR